MALVLAVLLVGQAKAARSARVEAGRLRAELVDCTRDRGRLQGALERQNAAIATMKIDAESRGRAVAEALSAARDEATAAAARAARIAAIEPRGSDLCTRMLDVDRQIARSK